MPVTIRPSPDLVGRNGDFVVQTPRDLLSAAAKAWTTQDMRPYLRTNKKKGQKGLALVPYTNGFVDGIIRAFNQDLHLVLRPDDVWLAILVQFSQYVAGNAEELRSYFVAHEGQEKLILDARPYTVRDMPVGDIAIKFTDLIQQKVIDPGLRDWMIPKFSTTTDEDTAVAAMVMMGSMKHYFEYMCVMGCGFPSVTLLGEKSDWDDMVARARRLVKYGDQAREWSALLIPILTRMARTFDEPDSQEIKKFWLRPAFMSGADGSMYARTLSGWITAFCFWDEEGKRVYASSDEDLESQHERGGPSLAQRRRLVLDGVQYPIIHPEAVPKSIITVPLVVADVAEGKKYETTLVAGPVGMVLSDGHKKVQPRSGWWMLLDKCEGL